MRMMWQRIDEVMCVHQDRILLPARVGRGEKPLGRGDRGEGFGIGQGCGHALR
jgi:hypothetical protein